MAKIHLLDEGTIDQIAAGEVVERPRNIVKELVENAIDAGANVVTVEIKEGGISMIRVTDNGSGIHKDDIEKAFMRHATSKIRNAEDLMRIRSLGFRGEALSSIAAVAQVELITKVPSDLTGISYKIHGGDPISCEEIGAPDGTTILVRNLFYNVPVRRKFLRSAMTEGSYIADMMEHLALSRPDVSFKFISGNETRFQTSGNGDLKEVIYRIYGKEVSEHLLAVDFRSEGLRVYGFIGKPEITRANRSYEICFVNGRYVKCDEILKVIEESCKAYLMQHKFPFCVLHIEIAPEEIDVNIHPSKLEIRFIHREAFCEALQSGIQEAYAGQQLIKATSLLEMEDIKEDAAARKELFTNQPEPFEHSRLSDLVRGYHKEQPSEVSFVREPEHLYAVKVQDTDDEDAFFEETDQRRPVEEDANTAEEDANAAEEVTLPAMETKQYEQLAMDTAQFLSETAKKKHRIIGQLMDTYWLIEYEEQLYIIDQHAAHEKVMFERFMKHFHEKEVASQMLSPAVIVTLSPSVMQTFTTLKTYFDALGFETELYGSQEVALRAIPMDLYGCSAKSLFEELLDELSESSLKGTPDVIYNKIASMACKAAVKGNMHLSIQEATALIDALMELDNPYHCPHGRPTIISLSKQEIERKFKRIMN